MVPKPRKSKRSSTRLVKKIEKKVREHHRKERKLENKKFRKSADPGIPISCPFRDQILNEIKESRSKTAERING